MPLGESPADLIRFLPVLIKVFYTTHCSILPLLRQPWVSDEKVAVDLLLKHLHPFLLLLLRVGGQDQSLQIC